jgi:hypothetical protein
MRVVGRGLGAERSVRQAAPHAENEDLQHKDGRPAEYGRCDLRGESASWSRKGGLVSVPKCGYGFGDQSWRAGRESVVLTFPNPDRGGKSLRSTGDAWRCATIQRPVTEQERSNQTLGEKLGQTGGGVICPPEVDPGMKAERAHEEWRR